MKEDLGWGSLGNGVTFWDAKCKKGGDFLTLAHIDRDRTVKFYEKDISPEARKVIRDFARKGNVRMSASQPEFVMLKPLGVADKVLEKTAREYSKIAGEKVEVRVMEYSDDIYAFGPELACLKLASHFAGKKLKIRHSDGNTWMFVVFNDLNV